MQTINGNVSNWLAEQKLITRQTAIPVSPPDLA